MRATQILAPFTIYCHLKDVVAVPNGPYNGYDFVELGAGSLDVFGVLQALQSAGYEGYVSIEYEKVEDTDRGISKSVEHLKRIAADLFFRS